MMQMRRSLRLPIWLGCTALLLVACTDSAASSVQSWRYSPPAFTNDLMMKAYEPLPAPMRNRLSLLSAGAISDSPLANPKIYRVGLRSNAAMYVVPIERDIETNTALVWELSIQPVVSNIGKIGDSLTLYNCNERTTVWLYSIGRNASGQVVHEMVADYQEVNSSPGSLGDEALNFICINSDGGVQVTDPIHDAEVLFSPR